MCGTLGFIAGVGAWLAGLHSVGLALAAGALGALWLAAGRGAWVLAGIVLAGAGAGALRAASLGTVSATDISRYADSPLPVQVVGMVDSDPESRAGRTSFILRAAQIETHGQALAVTGQAAVTVPDIHPPPDYGDRVSLEGFLETPQDATNPGAFSWREYLARRGIYCEFLARRPQSVHLLGPGGGNLALRLAWAVRHQVLRAILGGLPPLPAAVLAGILIGWRADLSPALMDDFVRTGTVHILASAGLHVGIIALCLRALCERLTLPRKWSALLIIGTLCLYALICGGRPSVTRAVIMAVVYFAATLFERDPDLPTTLAVAALVILGTRPAALLESGFQLSFLTVLTLAVGMPVWNAYWHPRIEKQFMRPRARKLARLALELIGLSLLAQIGSLPIVARDYNEVSVTGIAANLLVVPTLFVLIPLGFVGVIAWLSWPAAGHVLFAPCAGLLAWIVAVVQSCAAPAWASRAVLSPTPAGIALYYAALLCVLLALARRLTPDPRSLRP